MNASEQEAARHVLHYFGLPGGYQAGGFITALLDAFTRADSSNQAKLATVYPHYAEAIRLALAGAGGVAELQERAQFTFQR